MAAAGGRSALRLVVPAACLLGLLVVVLQLFRRDMIARPRLHVSGGGSLLRHFAANAALDPDEPHGPSKTIVMAALSSENVSWVAAELPGWERAIYVVDAPDAAAGERTVPRNKGNEANVYLWYILQHYHRLPEVVVFLHSHRDGAERAWHVDNAQHSNVVSLDRLRLDSVLAQGYLSLRCIQVPGCPAGIVPAYDAPALPADPKTADLLPAALRAMFPAGLPPPPGASAPYYPPVVAAPCCAQFAVSRAQILQRPRADYQRFHDWLMATPLDNYHAGRIMEYSWHIIFGRDPYYCPRQSDCACTNYGAGCKG